MAGDPRTGVPGPPERNPEMGEERRPRFRGWDASGTEGRPGRVGVVFGGAGRMATQPEPGGYAGRSPHTSRGHAAAQGNTQRRQRTELPLRPLRRPDAPVTGAGAWRRGLRPHARVRGPTARVWGRPPPARRTCSGFQPCFCEAFCLGLNRLRKPAIWSHLRWLISSFSSKS